MVTVAKSFDAPIKCMLLLVCLFNSLATLTIEYCSSIAFSDINELLLFCVLELQCKWKIIFGLKIIMWNINGSADVGKLIGLMVEEDEDDHLW